MKTFRSSKSFFSGAKIKWETVDPGVKRKIMGYDDKIMLVHVIFEKGGVGLVHKHHHSQVSYVGSGVLISQLTEKLKNLKKVIHFMCHQILFMELFALKLGNLLMFLVQ